MVGRYQLERNLVLLAELSKVTRSSNAFRGLSVPDDKSLDVEPYPFGS